MKGDCPHLWNREGQCDLCGEYDTARFELENLALKKKLAEAEERVRELEGKITAYIHANTQAGLKRTEETGEAAFQAFCGLLDVARIGKPSGEGGEGDEQS